MSVIPAFRPLKNKKIPAAAAILGLLAALGSIALAAQDRFTLTAPNGIAFSEFKGYQNWPVVALSHDDNDLKAIAANEVMIDAYREGIPGNGKPFPDGSKITKIGWSPKKNPEAPFQVVVPGTLKYIEFIEKDSKRFPGTNGWGYAEFLYDAATGTFTEKGALPARAATGECHACHTIVAAKDYIFTAYPKR
ncbi:MAG: cytochrome P460 family protein [Rhodomicrobium sp.]